jgi:hypothetical protein
MIFFTELTGIDGKKVWINLSRVDYMETINDDITPTLLVMGDTRIHIKESMDYIKEKLHIINQHLR